MKSAASSDVELHDVLSWQVPVLSTFCTNKSWNSLDMVIILLLLNDISILSNREGFSDTIPNLDKGSTSVRLLITFNPEPEMLRCCACELNVIEVRKFISIMP